MKTKTIFSAAAAVGLLATSSVAFAGNEAWTSYEDRVVDEIEAERFQSVEGKWQIDVEFEDDSEARLYVYDIDDEEELFYEVSKLVSLTKEEVRDQLEFDESGFDGVEPSEFASAYAAPYQAIAGKWEVKASYSNGDVKKFYVYNIDDKEELVDEIAEQLSVDESEVEANLTLGSTNFDVPEKKDDYKKPEKTVVKSTNSEVDRDELIRALIMLVVSLLLSEDGKDSGIDLTDVLKFL